jgi:hypothetical protein
MPSILSLAFPAENPSLNRTAGAIVPVFLITGIAVDSLLTGFSTTRIRTATGWALVGMLFLTSFTQNYDLVFHKYDDQYIASAWNTSDMGNVMKDFIGRTGATDNVWIVPYAFWVDTRLPPFWAGLPGRDIARSRDKLAETMPIPGPKLFMFAIPDTDTMTLLQTLYPQGTLTRFQSTVSADKDFWIFTVP